MKRTKFKYQTVEGETVGLDWAEFGIALTQYKRGEIIIRKEINWDVAQMRKYFHGPVRAFILEELRKKPFLTTVEQLKYDFKLMYGPKFSRVSISGKTIEEPKSTADYTFDEYLAFLNRINEWCMENLHCELPPAEQVE